MARKIGIIGGMGPAAGCDLFDNIVKLSPAKKDQEHIHIILDSNASIPDRTAYILDVEKQKMLDGKNVSDGGSPIIPKILGEHEFNKPLAASPLPAIQKSAKILESLGCEALSMPCITAHYHEKELVNCVNIPFISITKAVSESLLERNISRVAILATDGSICGKIFEPHLKENSIDIVYPNEKQQQLSMDLIYKYVKFGNIDSIDEDYENANAMLDDFKLQGAEAVILGCTELPIAFKWLSIKGDFLVDSTYELAKATVKFAYS